MSTPSPKPATLPYASPDDECRGVLTIRANRNGAVGFAVCGLVPLAFAGFVFFSSAQPKDLGWVSLVVGAYLTGVGIWRWADRAPRLILGPDAFVSTLGNDMSIRWHDIADARAVEHGEGVYLLLRLVDPAAEPQPATLWNRLTFDRPPEASDGDILLPMGDLELAPKLILQEIRTRIDRNKPANT